MVSDVYMDEKIEQYIIDIIFATREPQEYKLRKTRSDDSLRRFAPCEHFAGEGGQELRLHPPSGGYVIPEDVRAVCHDVLRHRIGLTYEAEAENVSTEEIITDILNTVEVP